MNKPLRTLALLSAFALAAAPSVSAAQGQGRGNPPRTGGGNSRLSGTYELDQRRSDNPRLIVDRATRPLPPDRRDRVAQNWINRLDSPETLTLDVAGRSVSIMSSNAPRATFDADGRSRTETGPFGSPITTTASIRSSRLTVATTGNRGADFTVTFEAVPGGMRVTRRLDSEYQQTSVTVQSFYRRVSDVRWNIYPGGNRDGYPGGDRGGDRGGYPGGGRRLLVPEGTQLTGRLDRTLDMRNLRDGEHFTVTIFGGGPYDHAVLEGVAGRLNRPGGSENIAFDFNSIRLADGRSGEFEGVIESARLPNGTVVRVDRSGVVHDRDRSNAQTVQNGAVGAAVGAIIGAIAGGGKGAAIGAVAGGAGMILITAGSDLTLPAGSQLTISAVAGR